MDDQAKAWGQVAARYDDLYVDPYHEAGQNPVLRAIAGLKNKSAQTIADLGCGTGPFLPQLAKQFKQVLAVDFSAEMLKTARKRCKALKNIVYHQLSFAELGQLAIQVDVAVSMNSLVSDDVSILDQALAGMKRVVRPGGTLFGVVPSLEGLHYHVMHVTDLALRRRLTLKAAQGYAHKKAELHGYDLNTATFTFDDIRQHLWLREEVTYRLRKAGWKAIQVRKETLPWDQFAEGRALAKQPMSWDWAFRAQA